MEIKQKYKLEFKELRDSISKQIYEENKDAILNDAKNLLTDYDVQNKCYNSTGYQFPVLTLYKYTITSLNPKFDNNTRTVHGIKDHSKLANVINKILINNYIQLLKRNNFNIYYSIVKDDNKDDNKSKIRRLRYSFSIVLFNSKLEKFLNMFFIDWEMSLILIVIIGITVLPNIIKFIN
ncbi:hypothetical protein ACSW9V_15090 (plasmid) [Clostridium perfringens]|uniref:hypothetical protein n=1 Tax=Clostridium perfringens TaxID=1502 RepID=UPI000B38F760|nr:hypothetical protein [Clostridium perfringens]EGT0696544.1 hypothetical protein [Clostridium perfringens]MDU3376207.1 hypothetical protein [Clostridium perfringens]MDU3534163.1 hypothetical protein [Clostridium perfringens]OUN51141.1 hypothetical protein B5G18_13285 [Clostridium perfringens]OUP44017.1 hypothetical protein B5F20_13080 [Clostridium perfringens]